MSVAMVPVVPRAKLGSLTSERPPSSPIDIAQCTVCFLGGQARHFGVAAVAGREGYFVVQLRDAGGSPATLTPGETAIYATCADPAVQILRQVPYDVGAYKVTYCTETAGDFQVQVMLASWKTKAVVPLGAPLTVTVQPDLPCRLQCKLRPPPTYHVGEEGHLVVEVYDRFLNPIRGAMLSVQTNTKGLQLLPVEPLAAEGSPGHYRLPFYTERSHKYILKSYIVGNAGIAYPEPFELPVYILMPLPAPLASWNCLDDPQQQRTGTTGVTGTLTFHKRDRFGNRINADVFNKTENDDAFCLRCADPALTLHPATTEDASTFCIAYDATEAKTYILHLGLGDVLLDVGPLSLVIHPQPASALHSFIELPVPCAWAGTPGVVSVWLLDQYGNPTNTEDPQNPVRVMVQGETEPLSLTFEEPERWEGPPDSPLGVQSNMGTVQGDLQAIVNNRLHTRQPIVTCSGPSEETPPPAPLWLQFDCGQRPQRFVKCRVFAVCDTAAIRWALEYSDDAERWLRCATLLQVDGWCTSQWPYCGEHRFWRLVCESPHIHGEPCPCPYPHPTAEPWAWCSVEWYVPVLGKAYGRYTKPRAKLYGVNMQIGNELIRQCSELRGSQTFPLWVNNVLAPGKSVVELPNPPEQLVVRPEMSLLVTLKDSSGHQRLVGSEEELQLLQVLVTDPGLQRIGVVLVNNNNGTYTATFDGRRAGNYTLEVRYGDVAIPSPTGFTMLPAAVQVSNCAFLGIDKTYEEVKRLEVEIQRRRAEHDQVEAALLVRPASPTSLRSPTGSPTSNSKSRKGKGQTPNSKGVKIPKTTHSLAQAAQATSPSNVEMTELDLDRKYVDGLQGGVVGRQSRFRILARDQFFNHCSPQGVGMEEFRVTVSAKTQAPQDLVDGVVGTGMQTLQAEVVYEADGYYGVWYTLTRAGAYTLSIEYVMGEEPVAMQQFEVCMSAAKVHAESCKLLKKATRPTSPKREPRRLQVPSGEAFAMVLLVQDCYGNPIPHEDSTVFQGTFQTPWKSAEEDRQRRQQAEAAAQLQRERDEAARLAASTGQDRPPSAKPDSPQPEEVDPTNVWEPVLHEPRVVITPDRTQGPGIYTITTTAYTQGRYILHLEYDGVRIMAQKFSCVPSAPVASKSRVVSLSAEVSVCIECTQRTAIYYCRFCRQAFCGPCWTQRHTNRHRQHHVQTVIGVDDQKWKAGDWVTFGILTRDKYDNNVSIHENSSTAFEVTLEYIPRIVEPKTKEAKGKKKSVSIPFVVQFPDGTSWPVELLGSELILHLKRKILEQAGIPVVQQQLEYNGKVLDDQRSLADCGVAKDAAVTVEKVDPVPFDQVPGDCTNQGKVVWRVEFPVKGYGQYCLQLKIGSGLAAKNLHRFMLEAPFEEPKGKAAQQKLIDEMQWTVEHYKSLLGLPHNAERLQQADTDPAVDGSGAAEEGPRSPVVPRSP
uniref:Ubiquitin-like domain-containing protein n=1 Tax=Eutreptiella gymnastica TaxID=73025 RepID=A0A7S1INK6_9EUGL|mmetsp:Transcript_31989/g.57322  ORF Transcript_31989/g.57322 Transcript_31989/m.57322 type:complete len:1439 (+) Transcript_31989:117-4433(+)